MGFFKHTFVFIDILKKNRILANDLKFCKFKKDVDTENYLSSIQTLPKEYFRHDHYILKEI